MQRDGMEILVGLLGSVPSGLGGGEALEHEVGIFGEGKEEA